MAGAPCPVKRGLRGGLSARYPVGMSVKKQGGTEADRAARLAEQLRTNLRKRKAQARAADGNTTEADKPDD